MSSFSVDIDVGGNAKAEVYFKTRSSDLSTFLYSLDKLPFSLS